MEKRATPKFTAGQNIAMKIPSHVYDQTVDFYRNVLQLPQITTKLPEIVFEFGDKLLWLDKVDHLSQAEIWLEIRSDDIDAAAKYLKEKGVVRRDEIEPLSQGFAGFWIASPAEIIHLICND